MLVGQRYKQKPKQYGPFSRVQSSLFNNLESIGIDHQTCVLALPCWGPGVVDYSKHGSIGVNVNATFSNNQLNFNGSTSSIDMGYLSIESAFTLFYVGTNIDDNSATNRPINFYDAISGKRGMFELNYLDNLIYTTYDNAHYACWGSALVDTYDKECSFVSMYDGGTTLVTSINGEDLGAPDVTGNPSDDLISKCIIGAAPRSPLTRYHNGTVSTAIIFNTDLFTDQRALLSENPNTLWQRVAPISYFLPVGGSDDRIKFIPAFLNTTLTSNLKAFFIRILETNLQSTTLTSTINKTILRSILVDLSNTTLTSDIIISFVKTILVTLHNDTKTSDASINMLRSLISDLVNVTSTTDIEISIQGLIKLLVSLQNNTSTTNIDVNIFRELFTNLLNTTSTTDIDVLLESIIRLQASFSNNTKTTDITSIMLRGLLGVLNNNTSTTDVNITYIIRLLTGLNNTTTTSDINIILSNFKSLVATFSNATSTTNIDVIVRRELVSNILNLTSTSAINVLKKIKQVIKLENATSTTAISNIILRILNVNFDNTTLTSDDIKIILSVLTITGCDILSVQVFQDLLACVVSQDKSSCIVNCSKTSCIVNCSKDTIN